MAEDRPGTPDAQLYRRIIDWPKRLEREAPFLRSALRLDRAQRAVDFGCGPGEHALQNERLWGRGIGLEGDPPAEQSQAFLEPRAGAVVDRCDRLTGADAFAAELVRDDTDRVVDLIPRVRPPPSQGRHGEPEMGLLGATEPEDPAIEGRRAQRHDCEDDCQRRGRAHVA